MEGSDRRSTTIPAPKRIQHEDDQGGLHCRGCMPQYRLNDPVVFAFVLIPVLLALTLVWFTHFAWRRAGASESAARRAVFATLFAAAGWMALTWAAAESGLLRQWDRTPPPFALLVAGVAIVSAGISYGAIGREIAAQTPLWILYSGRNFDIVAGATAILVAWLVRSGRGGRTRVAVWNVMGLALLINVVTVAILSTPRIRFFGDDHVVVFVFRALRRV